MYYALYRDIEYGHDEVYQIRDLVDKYLEKYKEFMKVNKRFPNKMTESNDEKMLFVISNPSHNFVSMNV